MQSDKTNRMLVDSVHLQFGSHTVLQSAFLTAESGRVTGVLGRYRQILYVQMYSWRP